MSFEQPPEKPPQKQPEPQPTKERYEWSSDQQQPVCTTPPRIEEVHSTQYVQYETSKFQNAYAWAREHIPRRDVRTIETLEMFDSLIRQKLNAR